MSADAGHGAGADRDVVSASRDVFTGQIANRRVRAGGILVQRLIADRRVVNGRACEQGQGAVANGHIVARARHGIGAGALHGDVADRRVVRPGRGVLHGLIADRRVRIRGIDGGAGQGVVADRNVAGRRAGDCRQRVIADGDVARARGSQRMRARADHGVRADGDVVGASCDVFTGGVAKRLVRAASRLVKSLVADRRALRSVCHAVERQIADGGVAAAGRVLRRQRRFADRDAGRVLVGKRKDARAVDLIRARAGGGAVRDIEIASIVERRALDPTRRHKQIIGGAALIEAARRVLLEGQRRNRRRSCRKLDDEAARPADRPGNARRRR